MVAAFEDVCVVHYSYNVWIVLQKCIDIYSVHLIDCKSILILHIDFSKIIMLYLTILEAHLQKKK